MGNEVISNGRSRCLAGAAVLGLAVADVGVADLGVALPLYPLAAAFLLTFTSGLMSLTPAVLSLTLLGAGLIRADEQGGGELVARATTLVSVWLVVGTMRRYGLHAACDAAAAEARRVEQLRQSQDSFERSAQAAGLGVWDIPEVSRSTCWWCGELDRVLGYEPGELEQSLEQFRSMVYPEDLPGLEQVVNDAIDRVGSGEFEYRVRCKDGRQLWMLDRFRAERTDTGVRLSGALQDISARRRIESELLEAWEVSEAATRAAQSHATDIRRSEARVSSILDAVTDGILTFDASGIVSSANRAAEQLFGYDEGKLLGIAVGDLLPGPQMELRSEYLGIDPELFGGHREALGVRREGGTFPAEVSISECSIGDNAFVTCVVRDIAERHEHERALMLAREQAMAATEAKSAFLANMSHEIRTPLTAVLGFADVLSESELGPEQQDAVMRIRRSGDHLLGLINDILDLSKIEAGKMEVEAVPVDLPELARDVAEVMRGRAEQKQLAFELTIAEDVPRLVSLDPTRVRQVLLNLVGNAIKFTEAGAVGLTVARGEGDQIRFDVRDSGVGMSDAQAARLFQPFQQAESGTSRKFGGTGLGLTISRRLSEMMGGDCVLVQSSPGAGSTFRAEIKAPAVRDTSVVPRPSRSRAGELSCDVGPLDCHVLLAEDGADNQVLVGRVLRKAGAVVTIVEDGSQAVDRAEAAAANGEPFDVILMDMQMPVMDGYEATRVLRSRGYLGPIVALTANAMDGDRENCIAAGCSDYASKPIQKARLLAAIRGVVAGSDSPPAD